MGFQPFFQRSPEGKEQIVVDDNGLLAWARKELPGNSITKS